MHTICVGVSVCVCVAACVWNKERGVFVEHDCVKFNYAKLAVINLMFCYGERLLPSTVIKISTYFSIGRHERKRASESCGRRTKFIE